MADFTEKELLDAARAFLPGDGITGITRHGAGHINDTFLVISGQEKYILQHINTEIFRDPEGLMRNIGLVTKHIAEKASSGRATIHLIPDREGSAMYRDARGRVWRMTGFIPGTVSYETADTPRRMYESGLVFGRFQSFLSDFPAEELTETIPGFHDTRARFEAFRESAEKDALGRADRVEEEIRFALAREQIAEEHPGKGDSKGMPLRVTHNDTKMSNVLFDAQTGKGVCAIDLDTVMPGYVIDDFGEAIRSGVNAAREDERDLSRVVFRMPYFEAYARGFLEGAAGQLAKEEIRRLVFGAKAMTYENGLRFLKDHLDGDVYFHIDRPGQNLDRARCQFRFLEELEMREKEMQEAAERLNKTERPEAAERLNKTERPEAAERLNEAERQEAAGRTEKDVH